MPFRTSLLLPGQKIKNDDGIELMIPAQNPDLVPNFVYPWIKSKEVDIRVGMFHIFIFIPSFKKI
jgi:hypothetical protein